GTVRVGIGEEIFTMTVDSEGVSCSLGADAADLSLTSFQAHRVIFGPNRPSDVVGIPVAARPLEAWAPFPLSFLRADSV
ncbi:MAG: hypothetical protein VX910_00785, partial [Candidatus Latescibacterota bacterium]|nr:hypothetical protein [Candidatus Latescibacterota bacterium]